MTTIAAQVTLPTRHQELLLMAALLSGEQCADALRRWRNVVPIRRVDQSSGWLLPLLYTNLRQQGLSSPNMARYQYVYRHNWYKNNLLIREIAKLCAQAGEDRVKVVWLRGAALNVAVYGDIGARPINHVDLWVATDGYEQIRTLLVASGWSEETQLSHEHALGCAEFIDSFGRSVRINGKLFAPQLDETLWARIVPLAVKQGNALSLDPLDHLVYLCANAATWDARSTVLWVADAAKLIMSQEKVDWAQVEERMAHLPAPDKAMRALAYVVTLLGLPMPSYLAL